MELKPDSASIVKERTIVMEEYNMSVADNPDGRLYEQLFRAAYTVHPYYPTTIGLPEVIQNATYGQLKTFYEERYVPNQIVMTVVGDFQTEQMVKWIEEQFENYRAGRISFEQNLIEPPQTAFRQVADSMEVSASRALLGYHIPPTASADMPALRVLAHILGGASNSRLDKALKLDENLVLYVSCYPDFLRDASLMYVSFQCEPANEEKALRQTFSQIQWLAAGGVDDEELASAKEKLIADYVMANQTFGGRAETISHYAISGATALAEQYPALIKAVTAADVRRVARAYLDPTQCSLSLIEPKGSAIPDYAPLAAQFSSKAATPETAAGPAKILYGKLPNGLTLILREDHSSPTVCVAGYLRGGQWLEPAGQSGVAYLVASMLDKGTQKYSREEFQARKEQLGISLWNGASEDYLQVGFSGLADKMDEGLELLDQMLFAATFPEGEFEKAKSDQLQAIKSIEDQPWEYTHREIQKDLYQNSPYRNQVVGVAAEAEKLTRDDVLDQYKSAFVPSNVIISAVGDFDATALKTQMESLWGDKSATKAPRIAIAMDQPAQAIQQRAVFKEKDQNTFNYSWLGVGVGDPDFLPLVLTKRMLSTRLFYKWIYDIGIAYRMWTRYFPRLGQSRFYFEMGVSDDNFPRARQGILDDLQAFLNQPISAEELDKAKQDEITRHKMTYQTNQGIAGGLGSWEAMGMGYLFFENMPAKISAVTAGDVERVAKKYLQLDRYTFVNIGKAEIK
jgi:zinc protease